MDFEQRKRQQIDSLKRSTIIGNLTNEEKLEYKNYNPMHREYSDSVTVRQLESQQDFYSEYKRKWNQSYAGNIQYQVNQPEHVNEQDVQISNDNLWFFTRIRRKWSAHSNAAIFQDKLKALKGTRKAPYSFRLVSSQTYSNDLMLGVLKHFHIEKKKDELFATINQELLQADQNFEVAPLFNQYKKEILTMGPSIKITLDNLSGQPVFDQESVENYKEYLKKAVKEPVKALSDAISDTINSLGNISPKLLGRHAIPQKFEIVKELRDKFKTMKDLRDPALQKNEVTDAIAALFNKQDEDGNFVDKDNYKFTDQLADSLNKDLVYSLNHYGIHFDRVENNPFLDDVGQEAMLGGGTLTQQKLEEQRQKQTRSRRRITNAYWREQCQNMIKKDDPQEVPMSKSETNILKTVHVLEGKKQGIEDDENKSSIFDRITENTKHIASAISQIDQEIQDYADVFQRREKELKARPELKKRLAKYMSERKQEQLDLIDRAAGCINVLKNLALGEDLTALGKQILMEQTVYVDQENAVPTVTDVIEVEGTLKLVEVPGNPEDDGFVVLGSKNVEVQKGSVSANLSEYSGILITLEDIKKVLKDKYENNAALMALINDEKKAKLVNAIARLEGKSLLKMEPDQIIELSTQYATEEQLTNLLKEKSIELYDEIDRQYAEYKNKNLQAMKPSEVNELIQKTNQLRRSYGAIITMNKYIFGNNAKSLLGNIKNGFSEEDKKRFDDLSKEATMKFKIINDKAEEYRFSWIIQKLQTGDTSSDMYTKSEKKAMEELAKKTVFKNGKYKDGKSLEMRVYEFFNQKKQACALTWAAHVKEYGDYKTGLKVNNALNGNNQLRPEGQRMEQPAQKSLKRLFGMEDENEHEELHEENINELWDDEHQIQNERQDNENHQEHQIQNERKDEEINQEQDDEIILDEENINEPEINIEIVINEEVTNANKERRNHNERLQDDEYTTFNIEYPPESLQKFNIRSKDKLKNGKAFLVKCLLAKNLTEFRANTTLSKNKNADETINKNLQSAYKKLKEDSFKRYFFDGIRVDKPQNLANASMEIEETNKDFLWFINELDKLETLDHNSIVKLKDRWNKRVEYILDNNEVVDFRVDNKVKAVLNGFLDGLLVQQRNEKQDEIKRDLDNYNMRPKTVSLLNSTTFKGIPMKINPQDYAFDQHQQGDNRCWAASHTYVVNTFMKVHRPELVAQANQDPQFVIPTFTQNTFFNENNYKINEKVNENLEKKPDYVDDSIVDYKGEAQNIKNFLTQDRMGNPYTVADTVISKIPRTAERHIVYSKRSGGGVELNNDQKAKLGNYLMKKIGDELLRTQAPISILVGYHYYSIIGVDAARGTLECFNSKYDGKNLQKIDHIKVADLIARDKFELILPEYLNNSTLEHIKDEFGLKQDLYNEDGSMNITEEIRVLIILLT